MLTPKLVIDRSKFPSADDEYTPAQRKAVDRGIAQSLREYKQGKSFGPFQTAEDMLAALHNKKTGRSKVKNNKRRQA